MTRYTVVKRNGAWWVVDEEGYDAIAISYDTKKEAIAAMKVRMMEDKTGRY